MKLAHLILAHNEPKQLERLVLRLAHPNSMVYIHLDKKTDIEPFAHLKEYDNVVFVKDRIKVYWGTYNIVDATLNGFKEILSSGNKYEYINLLSGQDYPLIPQQDIHNYLKANPGIAFMNYRLFNPDWMEALPRIQLYHFNNLRLPGRYNFQWLINTLLPKRKLPNKLMPVGRSQWFTIPQDCVEYLVDYWDTNPSLKRFIKLTWAPDEFIFQTILYNSHYKDKMVNNDLRYIDWSAKGVSPKTLTMDDADRLVSSGKFFARKFDMKKNEDLLDFIDKYNRPNIVSS